MLRKFNSSVRLDDRQMLIKTALFLQLFFNFSFSLAKKPYLTDKS